MRRTEEETKAIEYLIGYAKNRAENGAPTEESIKTVIDYVHRLEQRLKSYETVIIDDGKGKEWTYSLRK